MWRQSQTSPNSLSLGFGVYLSMQNQDTNSPFVKPAIQKVDSDFYYPCASRCKVHKLYWKHLLSWLLHTVTSGVSRTRLDDINKSLEENN